MSFFVDIPVNVFYTIYSGGVNWGKETLKKIENLEILLMEVKNMCGC